MGNGLTRPTTSNSLVWQGVANILNHRCPTTTPLYEGGGGGGASNTCSPRGGAKTAPKATDPAALADELAARVSRLTVSHRDPHLLHEEKSEIANSLGELAHELHAQKG